MSVFFLQLFLLIKLFQNAGFTSIPKGKANRHKKTGHRETLAKTQCKKASRILKILSCSTFTLKNSKK